MQHQPVREQPSPLPSGQGRSPPLKLGYQQPGHQAPRSTRGPRKANEARHPGSTPRRAHWKRSGRAQRMDTHGLRQASRRAQPEQRSPPAHGHPRAGEHPQLPRAAPRHAPAARQPKVHGHPRASRAANAATSAARRQAPARGTHGPRAGKPPKPRSTTKAAQPPAHGHPRASALCSSPDSKLVRHATARLHRAEPRQRCARQLASAPRHSVLERQSAGPGG